MKIKYILKATLTKKSKKIKRNRNISNRQIPGRQDTWIDNSKTVYDGNGNQIGSIINNDHYWDNDRR